MNQESRITILFSFFLIFCSLSLYSQDSIPATVGINEKNNTKFQDNFFKALSSKATLNYKKAIEYLETCNTTVPNNTAVLFELSKNYQKLGRNVEALEYINLALQNKTDNLWMLEHKVIVLKKIADFDTAIITQKKIAEKYPKKKRALVYLHIQNKDIASAKLIINQLKEEKLLDARLRRIEKQLNKRKTKRKKAVKNTKKTDVRTAFEQNKSFVNLTALLKELEATKHKDLLKYSEQGLALFPAQPLVYLINGKVLNTQNKFKKALENLQNGIDFVIDNTNMEAKFYTEISKAYKGLNNTKKAAFYKNKATKVLK